MATALVFGATGFLGHNLVGELKAQGWRVIAVHRHSAETGALASLGAELAPANLLDRRSIMNVMPGSADVVFHCAADRSLWRPRNDVQRRFNVKSMRNIHYIAQNMGASCLVHASCAHVFMPGRGRVATETSPQYSTDFWVGGVAAKVAAENMLRTLCNRGVEGIIVNPGVLLGPYDRGQWLTLCQQLLSDRLPAVLPGIQRYAHAPSVARAMIAAAERGGNGENYLLGGPRASQAEMLEKLAALLAVPAPGGPMPGWRLRLATALGEWRARFRGRQPALTRDALWLGSQQLDFDDAKARAELGYDTPDLDTCLAETVDWLSRHNLLGSDPLS